MAPYVPRGSSRAHRRAKREFPVSNLIRCSDGRMAPASIICRHLLNGESSEWVELPQPDGGEVFDYMCGDCIRKGPPPDADDLLACCFHCTRRMMAERDIVAVPLGDFR